MADYSGGPLREAISDGIDTRATQQISEVYDTSGAQRLKRLAGRPLTS